MLETFDNSSPPSAAYMRQWIHQVSGSGNGLLPVRHQAITWINADLLSIGPFGTNPVKFESKYEAFR